MPVSKKFFSKSLQTMATQSLKKALYHSNDSLQTQAPKDRLSHDSS